MLTIHPLIVADKVNRVNKIHAIEMGSRRRKHKKRNGLTTFEEVLFGPTSNL